MHILLFIFPFSETPKYLNEKRELMHCHPIQKVMLRHNDGLAALLAFSCAVRKAILLAQPRVTQWTKVTACQTRSWDGLRSQGGCLLDGCSGPTLLPQAITTAIAPVSSVLGPMGSLARNSAIFFLAQ
jgi:hypothetical protein